MATRLESTSQDLALKKSEKSAICKAIELKFGVVFGPLCSKTNINLQLFDYYDYSLIADNSTLQNTPFESPFDIELSG